MSTNNRADPTIEDLKNTLIETLDMHKAEDIQSINLKGTGFPADYMIIASGRSGRQVIGLAENILDKLSSLDIKEVKKEGFSTGDWVILDTGDIILHLFKPEVRVFYDIEKMWNAAPMPLTTQA